MSVYLGYRQLVMPSGGQTLITCSSDDGVAKRSLTEASANVKALLQSQIFAPGPNGQMHPTGMTVADALKGLGIQQVAHHLVETELEGQIAVQQGPRLIIPH